MKKGSTPSDRSVSRQSRKSIAMSVVTVMIRLLKTRAGRVRDDRLDAADVVGQPALDLAGPGLGEEAQRHPLEVRVQGVAQVLHDALADDVVEYDWPTPIRPLTMGTTIISATKRLSCPKSCCGMASSMSSLSRTG